MPVAEGQARVGAGPYLARWRKVKDGDGRQPAGMAERQPAAVPAAAVTGNNREALEAGRGPRRH